jgi:hypothetical protein
VGLCERYLGGGWRALLLPACLLLTAAWQLTSMEARWAGGSSSTTPCIWLSWPVRSCPRARCWSSSRHGLWARSGGWTRQRRAFTAGAVTIGLAALLVAPSAWALSSVLVAGPGALPSADLARLLPVAGEAPQRIRAAESYDPSWLVAFLEANRAGERYLLAHQPRPGSRRPIIINSGHAVMAMGGFHGLDPILTPDMLAKMVAGKEVRFVMVGDATLISGGSAPTWRRGPSWSGFKRRGSSSTRSCGARARSAAAGAVCVCTISGRAP